MQIVHFTDSALGSFDWELPSDLATKMEQLPVLMQKAIRNELERLVKANLYMLTAALKMGPHAEEHLDFIKANMAPIARELGTRARKAHDDLK